MSKHKTNLQYIYKINSSRLRKSKWNLSLTMQEAIDNEEMVALADSSVLRFIRQINNIKNNTYFNLEEITKSIRLEIESIKRKPTNIENRRQIKRLYEELYNYLFVQDYICVVIDNLQDFKRMNSKKGFYINGIKFKRLLATTGGAKKSTVVYVNEDMYDELCKRIENGRDMNKSLVPAKLEAYKALACSASIPVSNPDGVLVVKDCETTFKTDVIKIDDTGDGYPKVTHEEDFEITLNDSDGFGLILPHLSRKWCNALGEDYTPSGFCIRNSFCKGMLFSFDYIDFANTIAKNNIVVDAWGHPRDITKAQIVLTTSMLKLWDSYDSIEHYLKCCEENGYSFSITKMLPKELENERHLNYQFIQSLELTDEDIDNLIEPTVTEIQDVLGDDYRKSLLFLKGIHMNEDSFNDNDADYVKALAIEPEMINDPYVRSKIHSMIRKRINEAKVGVLKVRGNFSAISGDPYSLCQSMYGMKVTGLLAAGEFYSQYWNDRSTNKVACFRAPMTCHNNIRVLRLRNTDEMKHWYKYMTACTIFNSWDTTTHALNGADKDGDSVLTTDNQVILKAIKELPAIVCVQKTASKKVPSEEDLIKSNVDSFGDDIGRTTNRITAMFDVKARFESDSIEYRELEYRIQCGQNYQQNAIDKAKGIQSKPMPKEWFDYFSNKSSAADSEDEKRNKEINRNILADKKPYFFIYIYPEIKNRFDKFKSNVEKNCLFNFGITLQDLISKNNKTDRESEFLKWAQIKSPVFMNNSVMNKICWKIEDHFDSIKLKQKDIAFDYSILKSDKVYSKGRYAAIKEIYDQFTQLMQDNAIKNKSSRMDEDEKKAVKSVMREDFKKSALDLCSDYEELTNIVLDMCYKNNNSKQFAWDLCGDQIIKNLLQHHDYNISFPILDEDGDIDFGGEKFSMYTKEMTLEQTYEINS